MTSTDKKVTRITRDRYNILWCSGNKAREIVVSIIPGDVLEFREAGCRARFTLPIDAAFKQAVRNKALADARKKAEEKAKKKGMTLSDAKKARTKVSRSKLR